MEVTRERRRVPPRCRPGDEESVPQPVNRTEPRQQSLRAGRAENKRERAYQSEGSTQRSRRASDRAKVGDAVRASRWVEAFHDTLRVEAVARSPLWCTRCLPNRPARIAPRLGADISLSDRCVEPSEQSGPRNALSPKGSLPGNGTLLDAWNAIRPGRQGISKAERQAVYRKSVPRPVVGRAVVPAWQGDAKGMADVYLQGGNGC